MISFCPLCGHSLGMTLLDGLSSCINCNRIFESTPHNRLLSAAWLARHYHLKTAEELEKFGFLVYEAKLVEEYVIDKNFSHEEFSKFLKTIDQLI